MSEFAEGRYPEILVDLAGKVDELLVAEGLLTDQAKLLSWKVVALIGREWAGQQVYVGKGVVVTERDLQIYREFDGANHDRLALKYGLTARQIYTIVARVREWEFRARQGELFDVAD